jgi:ATP-binding protein involved in chromosome partitioning
MRIAVPLSGGQLSQHFGHSEQFLFVDADLEQKQVLGRNVETTPEHSPGALPKWLAEHGVNVVIASGMGEHARDLLAASSVQVFTGVSATDPEVLVADFIHARLETGANHCDHSRHNCNH